MGPRAGLDERKISSLPGFDPSDRPARSPSLYRLSYPAHVHMLYFYLINRTGYSFLFYSSVLKPVRASVFIPGCRRGGVPHQCVASCGTRPVMRSKINCPSQVYSLAT